MTEEAFSHQSLIQDGVIRQLESSAKQSKRVSDNLRSQQSHIPWQDIAVMRDKLIHDYFGVDIEKVWLTAKDDLPMLRAAVAEILESLPPESANED